MGKFTLYMHVNLKNNKKYVGITCKKPEHRWGHEGAGYKKQRFYRSIKKYGWDNFEHIIIEAGLTEENAKELETEFIVKYNTTNDNYGYNMTFGGECEIPSELTRRKMSESNKGRIMSDETRKKIGEANSRRIITEETRKKLSASITGKFHSEKTKERCRLAKIGKKRTEESRKKQSINHVDVSGKNNPMYGKEFTEQHKLKISESLKGKLAGERNPMYGRKRSGKFAGHSQKVLQLSLDGEKINEFINITEASKFTSATRQHISKCCKGERNKTGGYKWEYINN